MFLGPATPCPVSERKHVESKDRACVTKQKLRSLAYAARTKTELSFHENVHLCSQLSQVIWCQPETPGLKQGVHTQ